MWCGTRVLWAERRRKGSGEVYQKAIRHYYPGYPEEMIPPEEVPQLTVCEGKITATIRAVEEPSWGYSYAALEVTYRCERCGATHFPHLPTSPEELSRWITDVIEHA